MNTKYLTIEEFDKKVRADLNKFVKYVNTNQEDEDFHQTHNEDDWYAEFADYCMGPDYK